MNAPPDTYYIQRIQAGDTAAFAHLYDKYSRQIHSLIFRMLRNREDSEELTQDVFVKAFKHLHSFKGESAFSTWLYRIAYNAAISKTRKRKHELLALNDAQFINLPDEESSDTSYRTNTDEQLQRLEKALQQLPPNERALILLFYMDGKSIEETANATHLSLPNVKTKLHRIRKKLLASLKSIENNDNR